MEVVAELRGAVKRFGGTTALDGVNLQLHRGEVLALLGPNGAGKTTALSLLLGLRGPDHGEALLFGRSARELGARQRVGSTPQETALPDTLRVAEILDFIRAHYPQARTTTEILQAFDLTKVAHRMAGGLSGGQRRRLAAALAFVGSPEAVFLDEPTTGLDVGARRSVWDAVRSFVAQGRSVLLTTHYLDEVTEFATRVVLLHRGRVVAEGSPGTMRERVGLSRVRFSTSTPHLVKDLVRSGQLLAISDQVTVLVRSADDLVRALVQSEVPFSGLTVEPASLEEAFLALTGGVEAATNLGPCAG